MRVRFWGARARSPRLAPRRSATAAIPHTLKSQHLIIDCETGIRQLGQHLLATKPPPLSGHILISHTHWDHIQGISFFGPFLPLA